MTHATVWLIGLTVLVSVACARVQSHFELPALAAEDPSFLPTIEAYTSTAHGGNSATLLLNGDQIFPAQLEAIRAARQTISYAQYFYEEGPIGQEIAEALAERCRAGIHGHILLDGFGTIQATGNALTLIRRQASHLPRRVIIQDRTLNRA